VAVVYAKTVVVPGRHVGHHEGHVVMNAGRQLAATSAVDHQQGRQVTLQPADQLCPGYLGSQE